MTLQSLGYIGVQSTRLDVGGVLPPGCWGCSAWVTARDLRRAELLGPRAALEPASRKRRRDMRMDAAARGVRAAANPENCAWLDSVTS